VELSEEAIQHLEAHMPELFAAAVTQAYWAALAADQTVVQREGDALVAVSPDGSRRMVSPLAPWSPVGSKVQRKLL
jgi:hypothetical protein